MLSRSYLDPSKRSSLLAYTPMFHSRLFQEGARYRDQSFQATRNGLSVDPPSEPDLFLDGNPSFDRPLIVQFCANNPDDFLRAARYVEPFCDAVDLNLGCPQGIASRGGYGAFLQEDWELIHKLIRRLSTDLTIPVTAKIRVLESKERTLAYARMVIDAGASILTVHGRQRHQKGHETGLADWSVIRYLRDQLPKEVVLFANGNILEREDIETCRRATGADGVMSAEGNLCDPTIFGEAPRTNTREYWMGKDGRGGYRMDGVMRRYLDIIYRYVLEQEPPERQPLFIPSEPRIAMVPEADQADDNQSSPPAPKRRKQEKKKKKSHNKKAASSPNLVAIQAHLFHLLRPLVSKHTSIRDALARCRADEDMAGFEQVLSMVEKVCMDGMMEYYHEGGEPENQALVVTEVSTTSLSSSSSSSSSAATVQRCKRPFWICQPYVRPLPAEALAKGSLTLSKKEERRRRLLEEDDTVG